MSDFPRGGVVEATRFWLDKKGFVDMFNGWEADAILGKSDDFVKSKFHPTSEDQDRAEMFCGLLSTARQSTCNLQCWIYCVESCYILFILMPYDPLRIMIYCGESCYILFILMPYYPLRIMINCVESYV